MSDKPVYLYEGEPVTNSCLLARGLGWTHEAVLEYLKRNSRDLDTFGLLRIGKRFSDTWSEIALLNEKQSMLVLALIDCKQYDRMFRLRLLKEFYQMAKKQDGIIPSLTAFEKRLDALVGNIEQLVKFHGEFISVQSFCEHKGFTVTDEMLKRLEAMANGLCLDRNIQLPTQYNIMPPVYPFSILNECLALI
ncbi:MAG: hypothetical protein HQL78_13190 [Magnetococcales bacterium]|nr:hypothetical protein [Magnetococcales bacterium]